MPRLRLGAPAGPGSGASRPFLARAFAAGAGAAPKYDLFDRNNRDTVAGVQVPPLAALLSRPDDLIPTFSVRDRSSPVRRSAERLAHPAGKGLNNRTLNADALKPIASGLSQAEPQSGHVWTQGTRRRYTRLLETALYDAWLIHWSPAADLELHDHGGSQGVVEVVTGRLVETYTDISRCHPLRTQIVNRGESLTISATRIHAVSNPGPHDALSVHVYSPPLRDMTFFDSGPQPFLTPLVGGEGELVTGWPDSGARQAAPT
jgi:Cysteine dioxygenase type I